MLGRVFIGVVALFAAFAVVVAVQPSSYRVERSIKIAAPAEVLWGEISDLNQWSTWSPWNRSDPTQKATIQGEPGTVGHKSSWVGKAGKGAMTISEATSPTRLVVKLEFFEPTASVATTTFDLADTGRTVQVTWSMKSDNDFIGKLFGLFVDMDEVVGKSFEQGLAGLERVAEAKARLHAAESMAATDEPPETEAAQ